MVIIGVLVAIAVPVYLNYRKGAADKSAQSDVRGGVSAVEQFYTDHGNQYPETKKSTDGSPLVLSITGDTNTQTITVSDKSQIGYVLARSAFADFKKRVDYSEFGGAPLLGVKGVCIICHGRSTPKAIRNAIRIAAEFASGRINEQIESELTTWSSNHNGAVAKAELS